MIRPSGAMSANAALLSYFVGGSHPSWPQTHGLPVPPSWLAQAVEQNPSLRAVHVHPGWRHIS
jgi:hypothetical protein